MDPQEFREFVIKSAQKYIFEGESLEEKKKTPQQPKSTFTKKEVSELPKVVKASKASSIATTPKSKETKEEIVQEGISPDKIKILAEEMKKINKKIDLRNPLINPELFDIISEEKKIVNEDQSERWKNLYNYEIPKDESR